MFYKTVSRWKSETSSNKKCLQRAHLINECYPQEIWSSYHSTVKKQKTLLVSRPTTPIEKHMHMEHKNMEETLIICLLEIWFKTIMETVPKALPFVEELLAVDGCWESHSPFRSDHLVKGQQRFPPFSSCKLYIGLHIYIDTHNI